MFDRELAVRQLQVLTEDPFGDLDEDQVDSELVGLIRQVDGNDQCSADCYVSADDELLTCSDMDHDSWEEEFFAELGSSRPCIDGALETMEDEDEDDDYTEDIGTPELKIKAFSEALVALENVSTFLESKGYTSEATNVVNCSNQVACLHCKHLLTHSRQTSLLDYTVSVPTE